MAFESCVFDVSRRANNSIEKVADPEKSKRQTHFKNEPFFPPSTSKQADKQTSAHKNHNKSSFFHEILNRKHENL